MTLMLEQCPLMTQSRRWELVDLFQRKLMLRNWRRRSRTVKKASLTLFQRRELPSHMNWLAYRICSRYLDMLSRASLQSHLPKSYP